MSQIFLPRVVRVGILRCPSRRRGPGIDVRTFNLGSGSDCFTRVGVVHVGYVHCRCLLLLALTARHSFRKFPRRNENRIAAGGPCCVSSSVRHFWERRDDVNELIGLQIGCFTLYLLG